MSTESQIGEKLSGGLVFRPATIDDLEAVHGLYTAYWEAMTGVVKFTLEDVNQILKSFTKLSMKPSRIIGVI
jgi:hypothetical protein